MANKLRPVEPKTVTEAKAYVGRKVRKFFPPAPETKFKGGLYNGEVTEVWVEEDKETNTSVLVYSIRYEDDDGEDIVWNELDKILLRSDEPDGSDSEPEEVAHKRRRVAKTLDFSEPSAGVGSGRGLPGAAVKSEPGLAPVPSSGEDPGRMNGRMTGRKRRKENDDGSLPGPSNRVRVENGDTFSTPPRPLKRPEVCVTYTPGGSQYIATRRQGLQGHLKKIKLENFMCHSNFELEFGEHVTVVSGTNGSGKSAILQALQCCLGTSARNTGRASKLEDFIKTGCHEAKVQVTLWNTGEDAYQPDLLGPHITIERRIGRTNGFKLMNSSMKVVTGTRKDLIDPLLDHFNINASNPLAVLTQDTARSFLGGAVVNKKKYDLFMEATLMRNIQDNLTLASGSVHQMGEIVVAENNQHKGQKQQLNDLRERLGQLQKLDSLRHQLGLYQQAICWRGVFYCEEREAKALAILDGRGPEVTEHLKKKSEKAESTARALQEQLNESKRIINEQVGTMQKLQADHKRLQDQVKAYHREVGRERSKVAKVQDQLDDLQQFRMSLLSSQKDADNEHLKQYEEEKRKYDEELGRLDGARDALGQEIERLTEDKQALVRQWEEVMRQEKPLKTKLEESARKLVDYEGERRNIEAASQNTLAAFGGGAAVKLRQIMDSHPGAFQRPPIGPLGTCLALKDSRWARAVECALGGVFNNWIVSSKRDLDVLRDMAKSAGYDPNRLSATVVNYDVGPYNIPPHRLPPSGFISLMSLITAAVPEHPELNHVVMNLLIDKVHIEVTVMVEKDEICRDVLYKGIAGPQVGTSYSLEGLKLSRRGATILSDNWGLASIRPRLGLDVSEQRQQLEAMVEQEHRVKAELQQQWNHLQAELVEVNRRLQQAKQVVVERSKARFQVDSQYNELAAHPPELQASQGNALEKHLHECDQNTSRMQLELAAAQNQEKDAQEREEEARRKLQEKKKELEDVNLCARDATDALDKLTKDYGDATSNAASAKKLLEHKEKELEVIRNGLEQVRKTKEENTKVALQTCSREEGQAAINELTELNRQEIAAKLHKKRTAPSEEECEETLKQHLERKMSMEGMEQSRKMLQQKITRAEQEAGANKEELEVQVAALEQRVQKKDLLLKNLVTIYKELDKQVGDRWNAFDRLFDNVQKSVSLKFANFLGRRNHLGKMVVNRDAGELELHVKVNTAKDPNAKVVKDLKQLSGGERSFTTVAFLLALGEWTESPFRVMDEYDVYMDAINRRVSTETLLEFAVEHDNLQFIFLTPQDLQAVEDAKRELERKKKYRIPQEFVSVKQIRPARPTAARG